MLDAFGKILGTSVFPAASLPQPSQSSRTFQEPAGWAGHPVPRPALSGRMESRMPSAPGWPLNRVGSHVLPVTREGQPKQQCRLGSHQEPTAEPFLRPEGGEESGQDRKGELAARMPG